jgi:acetyl esterase/lipase
MPYGYLFGVLLVGWGVGCALTSWRRLGALARVPALVVSELPFAAGYLLVASTALAFVQGDLDSVGGAGCAAVAVVDLTGIAVIVRWALRADQALHNPAAVRRPWSRIAKAPLRALRPNVVRTRNLPYGDGRHRTLDVYHRRDRPTGAPVVLHLHGGAFHSGNKGREARPLMGHLVGRGMVAVSADYRLRPQVSHEDQVADVRAAIGWVQAHAAEYGGDSRRLFLTGSSAGAYLAVEALLGGVTDVAGVICRYGYYGDLAPTGDLPPMLVIHGENDLLVPPSAARDFADRMRAGSDQPVEYVELPGAHHDFDLYESIRSAAVSHAVERFIDARAMNDRGGVSRSPQRGRHRRDRIHGRAGSPGSPPH